MHTHAGVHTYIHAYIHTYIYMHACMHACIHAYNIHTDRQADRVAVVNIYTYSAWNAAS